MPDRDNWTAPMVLKWILTRDLPTVLAMAESYGADEYSADGTKWPVVPEDIDAVITAYCIDPELPPGQERTRTAVLRSQTVIAAQEEIYRALRCGDLEAQARRNGSGDVEKIPPNQWLALKFRSWNGYDLAVPIAIDQDVLDLPRSMEDYLRGRVPVEARPVVWPDPSFNIEQVLKLSTPEGPNQITVCAGEQVKSTRNETTTDRNQRWYNEFEKRRKSRNYGTFDGIFYAMSNDEFGNDGKFATVKKAVNLIRTAKEETRRR